MERRKFIRNLTIGTSVAALPIGISAKNALSNPSKKVRFGIITDVHNDVMHDGEYRLRSFLNAAKNKDLDFIIQLGDFCQPKEANKEFFKDVSNTDQVLQVHEGIGSFVTPLNFIKKEFNTFDILTNKTLKLCLLIFTQF